MGNVSGLTGIELHQALLSIRALLDKDAKEKMLARLQEDEDDETLAEEPEADPQVTALENLYDMLNKRAGEPPSLSFSSMSEEHLAKFGIAPASRPRMKPKKFEELSVIIAQTDALAADQHWSSDGLFKHLELLEKMVPQSNEAASRLWINAFFFRVAAVLSEKQQSMILSVKQAVPSITLRDNDLEVVSGPVHWTSITTTPAHRDDILHSLAKNLGLSKVFESKLQNDIEAALFVMEAKAERIALALHTPQAVGEMCACARSAGKKVIRGALTNGHAWIFLIVKMGKEITYMESTPITITDNYGEPSKPAVSLITAILAHWTIHSHEELTSDDYFVFSSET